MSAWSISSSRAAKANRRHIVSGSDLYHNDPRVVYTMRGFLGEMLYAVSNSGPSVRNLQYIGLRSDGRIPDIFQQGAPEWRSMPV